MNYGYPGYSYPTPVQNFINTNVPEFEARYVGDKEDIDTIIVARKTAFIDKKNGRLTVKDANGDILEDYPIILPKDEKDLKIEALQAEIEKMKEMIQNANITTTIEPTKQEQKSNGDGQQLLNG